MFLDVDSGEVRLVYITVPIFDGRAMVGLDRGVAIIVLGFHVNYCLSTDGVWGRAVSRLPSLVPRGARLLPPRGRV